MEQNSFWTFTVAFSASAGKMCSDVAVGIMHTAIHFSSTASQSSHTLYFEK